MQIRTNGEAATESRVSTYSIDVTRDYFGLGKPFDFNEVVKGADGITVVSDVNTSVSFDDAVNVELGGCSYALTKIIQSSHGSVRGIADSNRAEIWYSRDLRTALIIPASNKTMDPSSSSARAPSRQRSRRSNSWNSIFAPSRISELTAICERMPRVRMLTSCDAHEDAQSSYVRWRVQRIRRLGGTSHSG
jgi:hypothetical protein